MTRFDDALRATSLDNLATRIEAFPPGCDPDFDNELDLLEREFAELRLASGELEHVL